MVTVTALDRSPSLKEIMFASQDDYDITERDRATYDRLFGQLLVEKLLTPMKSAAMLSARNLYFAMLANDFDTDRVAEILRVESDLIERYNAAFRRIEEKYIAAPWVQRDSRALFDQVDTLARAYDKRDELNTEQKLNLNNQIENLIIQSHKVGSLHFLQSDLSVLKNIGLSFAAGGAMLFFLPPDGSHFGEVMLRVVSQFLMGYIPTYAVSTIGVRKLNRLKAKLRLRLATQNISERFELASDFGTPYAAMVMEFEDRLLGECEKMLTASSVSAIVKSK